MQEQFALLWKLFNRGVTPCTLDVWQEELMSIQLLQIPQSTISNTVSPRQHYHQKDSTAIRNRNVKTHPRKRKVQIHSESQNEPKGPGLPGSL